jgi:AcrR family transcriptional regulator
MKMSRRGSHTRRQKPEAARPEGEAKRPYNMSARAEAAAATGDRLLACAWRHFTTRPYEEVRLQDIAADAGVTVQTLHNRLGSKDQALSAAYWWWGGQESIRRDAAPAGDVRAAIRIVFDHYEAHGDAILRMLAQEDRIQAIRDMTDIGREYHRDWARRVFAPMLVGLTRARRERRLASLIVATDVLVWKLLRRDMRMDRRAAESTVAELIGAS